MQLTSRSAAAGAAHGAHAELARERPRRAPACGSRRTPRSRRPRAAPTRPRARCRRRRAPARAVRGQSVNCPSAAISPGASVFSAAIVPSAANVSVLAAPISRAAVEACVASASAACLCGIVTFAPTKPAPGERARGLGEQRRRHRQALVAPVVHPERGERRVVHRRRAAVRDRPAEDAERGASLACARQGACRSAGARRCARPPPCRRRRWLRIRRACSENTCSPQPSAPAT